jgi:hypothetical protein
MYIAYSTNHEMKDAPGLPTGMHPFLAPPMDDLLCEAFDKISHSERLRHPPSRSHAHPIRGMVCVHRVAPTNMHPAPQP